MEHSFNVEIAIKYGIEEAILFKNIVFWTKKNQANNQNYFDGHYWTYNSMKAFQKLFSYMTERQIRYALDKLIKEKLIIKGEHNQMKYDRTSWYAIGEKGQELLENNIDKLSNGDDKIGNTNLQNCQVELTKLSNGDDKIVEPIPYINTYINTNKDDEEDKYNGGADFDFQEDKISKILQEYGFINISSYILKTINESELTNDLKVEAVERWIGASDTTSQKLPSANYLKKILTNIKKSGAKTVEELETYENENKKSNSDRWYELQKEQVKLKQKELDLKEKNQPYYQKQIEMQSGKVEEKQQGKESQDKSMALFTQYYDDYIKGNITKEKLQELGMDESLFFQLDSDKENYENDLEMKRLKAEYEKKWGKKNDN